MRKKEINTLLLPLSKYWLLIFCTMLVSLSFAALFIFLGLKHHISLWIWIIGCLLSVIVPSLFVRLKINLFAKRCAILFSDEFFQISTSDILNETFVYSDVKYFSASNYEYDKMSIIKFIFRNGNKKRYIFFSQNVNDENVLNNVLLFFSSYNIGKIQGEQINMSPSFFLTKSGKAFVVVTGFIILAAIIIQVIYRPKATPASLLAILGGYLQAKGIQINDRKILDKFRSQNGGS